MIYQRFAQFTNQLPVVHQEVTVAVLLQRHSDSVLWNINLEDCASNLVFGPSVRVQVLNEVVVDRGPSSYLSNVDLYLDGRLITSVQGDGKGS